MIDTHAAPVHRHQTLPELWNVQIPARTTAGGQQFITWLGAGFCVVALSLRFVVPVEGYRLLLALGVVGVALLAFAIASRLHQRYLHLRSLLDTSTS